MKRRRSLTLSQKVNLFILTTNLEQSILGGNIWLQTWETSFPSSCGSGFHFWSKLEHFQLENQNYWSHLNQGIYEAQMISEAVFAHVLVGCSPTRVGPIPAKGLPNDGVCPVNLQPMPEQQAEADLHLTSDITAAFRTFREQMEEHFTVCSCSAAEVILGHWLLIIY